LISTWSRSTSFHTSPERQSAPPAHVYGHADPRDAQVAEALTLDEARRIASNIAKPNLLAKKER
jgi:hypothetical protein